MTQVPIVQRYCSCTDEFYNPTDVGKMQKDFEKLRNSGLSNYEALQKLNIVKLCCRESIFNPPMLFLNNENVGRIRDDTSTLAALISGVTRIAKKQETIKDTPDITPNPALPELL